MHMPLILEVSCHVLMVTFLRAIEENKNSLEIENNVTMEISDIMNSFYNKINLITI